MRLTITAFESLVSSAELRFLTNKAAYTFARLGDLYGAIPAINGKIELVYEGEQEGPSVIAQNLISMAVRNYFVKLFPDPAKLKRKKKTPSTVLLPAGSHKTIFLICLTAKSDKVYAFSALSVVDGLEELVQKISPKLSESEKFVMMEFVLHGMQEHSLLSKTNWWKALALKIFLVLLWGGAKSE